MSLKKIEGIVVSIPSKQTISVLVNRRVKHPLYLKQITRSKKFMVHDPSESAKIGDKVTIVPTRPISKLKNHILFQEKPAAVDKPVKKIKEAK